MSDVSKLMSRVAANEAPITARKILDALKENRQLALKVVKDPNPYRAMIFESGVIADPESIDGNEYYNAIVKELERLSN